MSDAAKKWGLDAMGPIVLGTVALVGALFGMSKLFGKGWSMKKNLEKIREALRFATDAAVPRVQAEATLALVEVASDLLAEVKEQNEDMKRGTDRWVAATERGEERDAKRDERIVESMKRGEEELAVLKDLQRLLRKLAGEPEPQAPAEPPAVAPPGETGVEP